MKLEVKPLAGAAALLWGSAVLLVSLINLFLPDYGREFLLVVASIYPGYTVSGSPARVFIATLYAIADGFIAGLIFGWLYNLLAGRVCRSG